MYATNIRQGWTRIYDQFWELKMVKNNVYYKYVICYEKACFGSSNEKS